MLWLASAVTGRAAPVIDARFALVSLSGEQVTQDTYRGRWMLVYFGYTHCPDICPTVLTRVGAALNALGPAADDIQPLFITVDPQRDTPDQLRRYLSSFSPRIAGLRGEEAQLSAAARSFHAYYRSRPLGEGEYSVDHSSVLYLLRPDATLAQVIPDGVAPEQLVATLRSSLDARPATAPIHQ